MARTSKRVETRKSKAVPSRKSPPLTISRPEMLVDGSDREFRRLVHGLFAFLARHQAIREGHAALIGLAGIEYTVLISIRQLGQEGDVHIAQVADHLHLSSAFITTITNRLVSKELVKKAARTDDRRRLTLTLTRRGTELLERLAPRQRQVNDVQFDCIEAHEFEPLLDMVERLVESSDRALSLQRYLNETEDRQSRHATEPDGVS